MNDFALGFIAGMCFVIACGFIELHRQRRRREVLMDRLVQVRVPTFAELMSFHSPEHYKKDLPS